MHSHPFILVVLLFPSPLPAQDRCDGLDDGAAREVGTVLLALEAAVPAAPARAVTAADLANASALRATCYDDGDVCPGGCDSHVVTNRADNGTARVHAPGSTADDWQACSSGRDCEICFGSDPADCFTVTYRGGGPDAGRADFTAGFWADICQGDDLVAELQNECDRIDGGAEPLQGRTSCLATPDAPGCADLAPSAEDVAAARAEVQDCLQRRDNSWRCYYQGPRGTLSAGACANGAVNSSGWDCCTGDAFHDACVTGCGGYYVEAREP